MSTKTGIEWTQATWNPIRGCSRVSEGCRHCYAEAVAARFSGPGQAYEGLARRRSNGEPQWTGDVRVIESHMLDPIRWRRPRKIFVNSMSDLFHENVNAQTIARIFAVMALAPRHTFQVLTKRPGRMQSLLTSGIEQGISEEAWLINNHVAHDFVWPLPNVWLGVSVENQAAADERIPLLLETPAAVRFLSCEPLLGPVCVPQYLTCRDRNDPQFEFGHGIDWIVAGGESGPNARQCHPDWVRSLRDQVKSDARVRTAFFFKQWGEWLPLGQCDTHRATMTAGPEFERVGKKRAGHLLDGREWHEFPAVRT